MKKHPSISCFCCTFRRPEMLNEMIWSFLQAAEAYPGDSELVILNDESRQTLLFSHPLVRIVNLPKRIYNLGEKHCMAVSLCNHEILTCMDDDDIFLPHRLQYIADTLRKGISRSHLMYIDTDPISLICGPLHGCYAFSRKRYIELGGYAMDGRTGAAGPFELRLLRGIDTLMAYSAVKNPLVENPFMLYRKLNTGAYHVSAEFGKLYQAIEEKTQGFEQGFIELNPHWQRDWKALCEEADNEPVNISYLDPVFGVQTDFPKYYAGFEEPKMEKAS